MQERVQGSAEGGAVARKRYFLHGGKMEPEPHIGEITAPYPARPKNKSGTEFLLMAQCFWDVNSLGIGGISRFWQ